MLRANNAISSAGLLQPGHSTKPRTTVKTSAKGRKNKEYGSGRGSMGIPPAPDVAETAAPSLSEYLEFGKLIGERPQDVKKQLDLNGQEVIVDKQSKEILEEWEYEQTEAYSMFEMLITRENEIAAAPTRNDVLLKNKNRQSEGIDRITRFVEREYLGVKPTTKADKKLSKNKKRVTYSGLEALQQAYDAYDAGLDSYEGMIADSRPNDTFERVGPKKLSNKPSAVPELAGRPSRRLTDLEALKDELYEEEVVPVAIPPRGSKPAPKKPPAVRVTANDLKKALPPKLAQKPPRAFTPADESPPSASNQQQPKLQDRPKPPVAAEAPKTPPAVPKSQEDTVATTKAPPSKPTMAEQQPIDIKRPAPLQPPPAPVAPKEVSSTLEVAEAVPPIEKEQQIPSAAAAASIPVQQPSSPTPPERRPQTGPPISRDVQREERRNTNLQLAHEAQANNLPQLVKVWRTNAAGVLVHGDSNRLSGFIPLSELSAKHAVRVLAEDQRLKDIATGDVNPTDIRRDAMALLMNEHIEALVVQIDETSGRVILSERALQAQRKPKVPAVAGPTETVLKAASSLVGCVVKTTVMTVKPFGVFVSFDIETQLGKETTVGLIHSSELSWDYIPPPEIAGRFKVGQHMDAHILFVDEAKARIFLSFRRAQPNPLLETLDSLMAASNLTASTLESLGSTVNTSSGDTPVSRQTMDASTDLRPLLGDLDAAVEICGRLRSSTGVLSVVLGTRLQSRAASQELEIYLGKADTNWSKQAGAPADYKLAVRQGLDVQEVVVTSTLSRDEMKQLTGRIVQEMLTDA